MGGDPRLQPPPGPPPVAKAEPPPPPPAPGGKVVKVDGSCVILRPGDTLVLAFAGRFTDEEYARFTDRLRAALPGDDLHIAVVDGVAAMAAYRPEPEA